MKIKNKFTTALLALAGMALVSSSAHAALALNNGDLFIGFSNSTATNDVIFDIGPATNFTTASSTVSLGNFQSDLNSIFGPSWYSVTNWSVFGLAKYSGAPGTTAMYLSGTSSTPLGALDQGTTQSTITGIKTPTLSDFKNLTQNTVHANGYQDVASGSLNANSYASYMPGGTNTSSTTVWGSSITGSSVQGALNSNLYLDIYTFSAGGVGGASAATLGGSGGYFTINNSGDASFQVVPEPSTYASLAIGLGIVAVALRRRTVKA